MTARLKRLDRQRWAAALLVLPLLLASCGSDGDADSFSAVGQSIGSAEDGPEGGGQESADVATGDGTESEAPVGTTPQQASALGSGGQVGDDGAALQPIDIGRDIIFTATIAVEVESVGEASAEALAEVQKFGGLLFGQQTTTEGINRTVLTFRVRPEDFQQAVAALGDIGTLRDQSISSDDVTERVVNIESQITTAEASVARLRGFLEGATALEQVANFENQLLDRETNLELLRGQLRTVRAQVDLATITLTITERVPGPSLALSVTAYEAHDEGISCQGEADLSVDEGDDVTICLVITNDGDSHLQDFRIADEGFGIDANDVEVTDGDLEAILEPGGQIKGYFEVAAGSISTGLETAVSAQVVNAGGADVGLERTGRLGTGSLTVQPDDSAPGFTDSLDKGVDVLQGIIGVIVILAGFFLPFVWVPVLLWAAWRFIPRRRPVAESSLPHPTSPTDSV